MGDTCERLRPSIFRVAEGEAGPDEAIVVGRHLPDCTVCRILLAREVRLAKLVSEIEEPIEVDESFLQQVMESLPEGPPPSLPAGKRKKWKGLKLAGFLAGIALLGTAGFQWAPVPGQASFLPDLPVLDFETLSGLLGNAREPLQFLLAALAGIGTRTTLELPGISLAMSMALLATLPIGIGLLSGAGFLMFAFRAVARNVSRSTSS